MLRSLSHKRVSSLVVFVFAVLHAVSCLVLRSQGVGDTLTLTILTIAMAVILCLRDRHGLEVTAISVILVNAVGYALGIGVAALLSLFMGSELAIHSLSTFLTTCLLGVSLEWFLSVTASRTRTAAARTRQEVRILVVFIILIFLCRVVIDGVLSSPVVGGVDVREAIASFAENTFVLVMMVLATWLFTSYLRVRVDEGERTPEDTLWSIGRHILFFIATSAVAVIVVVMGDSSVPGEGLSIELYAIMFLVAMTFEVVIFSVVYLIDYAMAAFSSAREEKERANLARYQYMVLKQQVNPHFLFNSLNVLDYLVADGQIDESRDYIRKLSGVYRYMLHREDEPVVSLEEEIRYMDMYIDLVKVRFGDGFLVEKDIDEEALGRYVVASSVQMLLENAIKHNATSVRNPLRIVIRTVGQGEGNLALEVRNNRIPRANESISTGLGLKYISKSYQDHGTRDIEIAQDKDFYAVRLPLL